MSWLTRARRARNCNVRCCSALALTVVLLLAMPADAGQAPAPRARKPPKVSVVKGPLPVFPMRTLWTLPLNNLLTAPPAFDESHGFFPIEGDRLPIGGPGGEAVLLGR